MRAFGYAAILSDGPSSGLNSACIARESQSSVGLDLLVNLPRDTNATCVRAAERFQQSFF